MISRNLRYTDLEEHPAKWGFHQEIMDDIICLILIQNKKVKGEM